MARSFPKPLAKKLRDFQSIYSTPSRISRSDMPRLSSLRPQATSIASAGSVHNVGDDPNMITKIQDPSPLNQVAQTYKGVLNIVNKFKPQHFDQLGMVLTYNLKVFYTQTLIDGNYALLNTTTSIPNPDYYGALLWHRLMRSTVLAVTQVSNQILRVYAHCAKKKSYNLRSTDIAKPKYEFRGYQNREEYHLATLARNIQGQIVLLNDVPMVPTETFDIPAMEPKLVNASTPISVASHSIVYVTIRDFQAPVCA
ncbi:hypothetical protein Gotur_009637 [Gossypium turneri]